MSNMPDTNYKIFLTLIEQCAHETKEERTHDGCWGETYTRPLELQDLMKWLEEKVK